MKRSYYVILITAVLVLCMLICGCAEKKAEKSPAPSPTPTADTGKSDETAASDDALPSDAAQNSDVVPSDDVTSSENVQEAEKLSGAWIADDGSFVLSISDEDDMCVIAKDGLAMLCDYTVAEDKLTISDLGEYTIVRLTKKHLTLAEGGGAEIHFDKLSKRAKDARAEDFIGTWTVRIEEDENYLELVFTLSEDGAAEFSMDDGGEKSGISDATWKIKSGRLILNNGTGTEDSELRFDIMQKNGDTCILLMDGMAVIGVRK